MSSIMSELNKKIMECPWRSIKHLLLTSCDYGYFCILNEAIRNGGINNDQASLILNNFIKRGLITEECLEQVRNENQNQNDLQLLQDVAISMEYFNYGQIRNIGTEVFQLDEIPTYPIKNPQILRRRSPSYDTSQSDLPPSYDALPLNNGNGNNSIHHDEGPSEFEPPQTKAELIASLNNTDDQNQDQCLHTAAISSARRESPPPPYSCF